MSYIIYKQSKAIVMGEGEVDPPFYAIIMAAMRKADTRNLNHLKAAFPYCWKELQLRFNAPGGFLSKLEAKSIDGYDDFQLKDAKFPQEGWPTDDYP